MAYDPVFGLQPSARLADTGSLGCVDRANPDTTDGLFVQVSGLTDDADGYNQADGQGAFSPAVAPCGQSLARAADGSLFAYPEGVLTDSFAGLAVTQVGGSANYNDHVTINNVNEIEIDVTNPLDCPVTCRFEFGEMKFIGQRRSNSGTDPHTGGESFYVTGYGEIDVAGDIVNAVNRMDLHGSWSGEGNAPENQRAWNMYAIFPLTAGQTKTVTGRIVTISKYHFDMSEAGTGIAMLHPTAMFWRTEPARPGD